LTERYNICILSYDQKKKEIITIATGDVGERVGREIENNLLAIIDPECRFIVLHLYEGLLKIIPLEKLEIKEAFNVRIEENNILDICFFEKLSKIPTIAILYEDNNESKNLKTYQILVDEKETIEGVFQKSSLSYETNFIISLPSNIGGILIISQDSIFYHDSKNMKSIQLRDHYHQFTAFCKIDKDGSRYLFGDLEGNLYVLGLKLEDNRVSGLEIEKIGIVKNF
jgi:DNA damage-binding protein 1